MKLDLSSYATEIDFKNVKHLDVSSFVLKKNLGILKTEVDKLDFAKLTPVPDDLANAKNTNLETVGVSIARLAQANLVTKVDFDIKLQKQNKKISNKTKHLLA